MTISKVTIKCHDCGEKFNHFTRMPKRKVIRKVCDRCKCKAAARAVAKYRKENR